MAGVVDKSPTPQERAAEAAELKAKETDLISSLVGTFDLPTSVVKAVEDGEKEIENKEKGEEAQQDELTEESESEVESDETEETSEESSETEESEESESKESEDSEEDEDLIPKSKVQKRFDEMTRRLKQLESELEKSRAPKAETPPVDPDMQKLEAMSLDQLRQVKREAAKAIRTAQDEKVIDELFALEEKVDRAISTQPQRFAERQMSHLGQTVNEIRSEIEDFDKVFPTIDQYALQIYNQAPELQGTERGKARAMQLAYQHYKAVSKLSVGKSNVAELERKVNTLKKKTSLATSSTKGNTKANDDARAYKRAKLGNFDDKVAFFRGRVNTDQFLPEGYK